MDLCGFGDKYLCHFSKVAIAEGRVLDTRDEKHKVVNKESG